MTHHYLRPTQVVSRDSEGRTCMDDLIRPGLSQAFPLPAKGDPDDERFGRLIEALVQRRQGTS